MSRTRSRLTKLLLFAAALGASQLATLAQPTRRPPPIPRATPKTPAPGDADSPEAAARAEAAFMEAERLRVAATPQSLREAAAKYREALLLFRGLKDAAREARVLFHAASVSNDLGETDEALELYKQSIAAQASAGDDEALAESNHGVGMIYYARADYASARPFLEEAFKVWSRTGNSLSRSRAQTHLGLVYLQLGEKGRARPLFEQALFGKLAHGKDTALKLYNIAVVYHNLGDYDEALEFYQEARRAWAFGAAEVEQARVLTNIGAVYAALGRDKEARAAYNEALPLWRKAGDRSGEASALSGLGGVARDGGLTDDAVSLFSRALVIHRETGERAAEAHDLHQLMSLWNTSGKPGVAVFYGKQAVNVYQAIRADLKSLDRETQKKYLSTKEETYRALVNLLIEQGRLPEAQQVLRMLKEEEYFAYVRRDAGEIQALAASADLRPRERAALDAYAKIAEPINRIGARFAALDARRASLLRQSKELDAGEQAEYDSLSRQLDAANIAFDAFVRVGLAKELPEPTLKTIEENRGLQADLERWGEGVVSLHTIVGRDRYRVILTTPKTQTDGKHETPAAALNKKVLEFRELVEHKCACYDPRPLGAELYRILVKPVEKNLAEARARTLVWSLDGVLRYLPVGALYDEERGQYLAERYENVVITLASRTRLSEPVKPEWRALALGVSQKYQDLPALSAVPDELRAVARVAERAAASGPASALPPARLLLDGDFTVAEFERSLGGYPLVHIASHFSFRPGDLTRSFLLLGGGDVRELSLDEVKNNSRLNFAGVELLTLSACNTATGLDADGSEVESFGALAQQRGAKAVMATLWPVADASTRLFMEHFYESRAAGPGRTKAAAMRAAQMALLRGEVRPPPGDLRRRDVTSPETNRRAHWKRYEAADAPPFSHPFFWAPFILIGNWR